MYNLLTISPVPDKQFTKTKQTQTFTTLKQREEKNAKAVNKLRRDVIKLLMPPNLSKSHKKTYKKKEDRISHNVNALINSTYVYEHISHWTFLTFS